MGDPAPVYDDDRSEEPVTRPQLEGIEGGGETTPRKTGHLKSADKKTPEELKEAESGGAVTSAMGAAAAASKELRALGAANDTVGTGFRREKSRVKLEGDKNSFRKKGLIGGGIVAVIALAIAGFLSLIPLKINHMVENAEKHFFASSESAVKRRSERLFSDYVKKHVLPGLKGDCTTTKVNKSCVAAIPGDSKLSKLYNGWRDGNLEGKLADKYGIEFQRQGSNVYLMKVGTDSIDISSLDKPGGATELRDIQAAGRSEVRAKWTKALEDETKLKQILYRFKVGRLLERKYGVKRCVFACNLRDNFADWKDSKKQAFKVTLAERVLLPRSQYMGILLLCLVDTQSTCKDPAGKGKDGEKRDKFQQEMDSKIAELAARFGQETVAKVGEDAAKILDEGFTKYVIDKVFQEETANSVKELADKAIPIVGWINTIASLVGKGAKLGIEYKRWVYVTNAAAMVGVYMMYRTHADEQKSGNVDLTMLGSVTDSLGNTAGNKGQTAEISPLYNDILGSSSPPPQTALSDLLAPIASAQGTQPNAKPKYTCDDNSPVPADKLVCPEENLAASNFITDFSAQFHKEPLSILTTVADFWNSTLGALINKISSLAGILIKPIIENTPGYDQISKLVQDNIGAFLEAVAKFLIPSPISDAMSGARAGDMLFGGADEAASSFGQLGIGGQRLSPQQVADIRNEQDQMYKLQFSQEPLYARLFSKDESRSLVSQVAMAMPMDMSSFVGSASTSLANPFSTLMSSFSSILSGHKTYAASAQPDPFSISQYGYALNDPTLKADPSIYTDQYCAQMDSQWTDNTTVNPDTGQDEHDTTDPCRLESDSITSAGAFYNTAVLDHQDTVYSPGE
jgi:hypothetical protein